MAKFFDLFPTTLYKLSGKRYSNYDNITNIMFRIGMVKETINNIASYYQYIIKDGETPEVLADRFYNDPEAHWMILYANDIYNPYKDWPMDGRTFSKYLTDKYGSVANAQTTYHHYEKVIRRDNNGKITETRFEIDFINPSFEPPVVTPYDSYNSLEYSYRAINFGETSRTTTNSTVEGQTIIEEVDKNAVTNYDWEVQQNEAKRLIKVIKKQYYMVIMKEFDVLTNNARTPFLRRLI